MKRRQVLLRKAFMAESTFCLSQLVNSLLTVKGIITKPLGGFPPKEVLGPAHHGVSGSGSQQVSFQQNLIGAVVRGLNFGGDVDGV
ncbi:hypothetical protein VZT92_000856 [Zoarces viviparus]|uniref:Uncharacterized protein n=1 Tax=Zoarces viviparus TaxID=48416 RepID=A0AAW1G851_ZOAVI